MVRIGHASIDESGHAKGGQAGDQTGKEVCIRNWYNKNWHTVLRPKSPQVAEKMVKACIDGCLNPNIGYNQNKRNSLRMQAINTKFDLAAIGVPCETDCSAFMSVCAEAAGVAMAGQYSAGNAPTTANMVKKFFATGMFDLLTDPIYLSSPNYLKKGDILVCVGHTVMVLDDGDNATSKPTLRKGSKGSWVKIMQSHLMMAGYQIVADGDFGPATERALRSFQEERGLVVDGVCGNKTWAVLMR